jgi:hypothetical protein
MKYTTGHQILNLAFGCFLVLGTALATQVFAEDYYTYQDANGKLVISNKKPPAGSKILKTQDLPEPAESENGKTSTDPSVGNNEKGTDKSKQ